MLTKFSGDLDIIAALDDEPNDVGGLTAAELKAKFDEGPKALAEYLNDTLTEEVEARLAPVPGAAGTVLESTGTAVKWAPRRAPNILLNWYFRDPVNQRGVTDFAAQEWGIDCWKCDAGEVTLTAKGIEFDDETKLVQHIRKLRTGVKLAVSVSLAEKVTIDYSGARRPSVSLRGYTSPNAFTTLQTAYISQKGVTSFTYTPTSGSYVAYGIAVDSGKGCAVTPVIVEALKVEENSSSTLAYDVPPDPALELLRCQSRLQLFSDAALCPSDPRDFRPVMDGTPEIGTVEVGGVEYICASAEA